MNVTNFKLSIKVINVQCAQNDKAKTSQLINYLSLHIKNISISSVSGCIRARCSLTVFPQGEKTRSLAVLVAGIANSCLAIVAIILGSFFSPQFSRTAVQSVPSSNSIGIRRLKYILLYCTVLVRCMSVESEPMVLGSGSVRFGKSLGSVRSVKQVQFVRFGSF